MLISLFLLCFIPVVLQLEFILHYLLRKFTTKILVSK